MFCSKLSMRGTHEPPTIIDLNLSNNIRKQVKQVMFARFLPRKILGCPYIFSTCSHMFAIFSHVFAVCLPCCPLDSTGPAWKEIPRLLLRHPQRWAGAAGACGGLGRRSTATALPWKASIVWEYIQNIKFMSKLDR